MVCGNKQWVESMNEGFIASTFPLTLHSIFRLQTNASSNQLCDFISQVGTAEVLDPMAIHALQLHLHLLLLHPSQLRSKRFILLHKRMSWSHSLAFHSLQQAFHLRFIQFAERLLRYIRDLQPFNVCSVQSNPFHRYAISIGLLLICFAVSSTSNPEFSDPRM